jgi:hypothetical protein
MFVKRRTGTGAVTLSQGETGASLLSDDFSSYADTAALLASGWDEFNGGLITISAPGEVTFTRTSLAVERGAILVSGFVVGQAYQIEADITAISSSSGIVYVATTPTISDAGTLSSASPGNNLKSPPFIATATSMYVGFRRSANGTTTYSRVQINAITETTVTVTSDWTRVATASATVTNPTVLVKLATSGDEIDVALFQHELGAFITSPIPTVASQVTRAADQVSILTSAFPYSATEGTVYQEIRCAVEGSGSWGFTDYSSSVNFFGWIRSGGNGWIFRSGIGSGTLRAFDTDTGYVVGAFVKMAASYADGLGNFQSVNGQTVVNNGPVDPDPRTPTSFNLGRPSVLSAQHIKRIAYYNTRKTDAELQVLST